jgi:ketosteroid isomerase-like protein
MTQEISPREVVLGFIADCVAALQGRPVDPFLRFHDDGVMIIPGTSPLSGVWRGRHVIYTEFMSRVPQVMGTGPQHGFCPTRVVVEGNAVAVIARARATAISGRPYNNTYFLFFEVRDGLIARYFEGFDSSLAHQAIFDVHLRRPVGALRLDSAATSPSSGR